MERNFILEDKYEQFILLDNYINENYIILDREELEELIDELEKIKNDIIGE